jgi:hypothetical protein
MNLTPKEQEELDLTKKLLESLLRYGSVYSVGSIYDKKGFLMTTTDLHTAVNCLNRLNFKIGNYVCRVERIDSGGSPTWALV